MKELCDAETQQLQTVSAKYIKVFFYISKIIALPCSHICTLNFFVFRNVTTTNSIVFGEFVCAKHT